MPKVVFLLACACTSPLPAPDYVAQPSSALEVVPFPPPPARVETVPKRVSDRTIWIDGEWTWHTRRWLWVRGRWVVPPVGAKYSPWTMTHGTDGKLYEARGVWRNSKGEALDAPVPAAEAVVYEGAITDTNGDVLAPGRTLSTHKKEVAP